MEAGLVTAGRGPVAAATRTNAGFPKRPARMPASGTDWAGRMPGRFPRCSALFRAVENKRIPVV